MKLRMRGCGLSLVAVVLGGCHLLSDHPVANAGPDRQVPRNSLVTLDGSGSHGGQGQDLVYRWAVVSAPAGVEVALSDAETVQPTFTASVEGAYVFGLAVWRGPVFSEVDRLTITAVNSTPTAAISSEPYAAVGQTVTLDGALSADPDGDPVTHAWTLVSPEGSAATLSDPTASRPTFVPDVRGDYTAKLRVSDGVNQSAEATASVTVIQAMLPLELSVVDAEYSHALDRVILVATDPDALHVLDPSTGASTSFPLTAAPTAVGLDPTGLKAMVGHALKLSHVDLSTLEAIGSPYVLTVTAGDVALSPTHAYVFPSDLNDDEIRTVRLSDGATTLSDVFQMYKDTRARLHPSGTKLYGADNGISPSDIFHYRIDPRTGTASLLRDSPYHGDYEVCGNLWLNHDGAEILTACGYLFRATDEATTDLTHLGQLINEDGSIPRVKAASQSPAGGAWAAVPDNDYWDDVVRDIEVQLHDPETFAFLERHPLPPYITDNGLVPSHGRFVFHSADGSRLYVLVQPDPDTAPALGFGLVTY